LLDLRTGLKGEQKDFRIVIEALLSLGAFYVGSPAEISMKQQGPRVRSVIRFNNEFVDQ
jgi:hypothetical protein